MGSDRAGTDVADEGWSTSKSVKVLAMTTFSAFGSQKTKLPSSWTVRTNVPDGCHSACADKGPIKHGISDQGDDLASDDHGGDALAGIDVPYSQLVFRVDSDKAVGRELHDLE
ncbi:hypothetical protein HG531_002497 [Fusarium graminearum]|nr:hypothetical protein HG531_002497 [Fusarium graminearum]